MTTAAATTHDTGEQAPPQAKQSARRPINPVLTVARKEWLDIRRDARWRALVLVTTLLMVAALALGLLRTRLLEREHHAAEAGDRHVWTSQGAKNPHSAAHFGQYAFKPVGPLALAEPGVDAYVGGAVYLEAHRQNEVQFRTARDATLAARMGHLTLAFVLQAVLPLVAILLGFAAFSGEREQGTLLQLVSLGVRPAHLLLGKALAGAGVLLGLLAIASVGLGAGLALFGSGHLAQPRGDGLRLVGMALGYALYLLGFLALALGVSARARSSRAALVGLVVFWLLNSFLVPRWVTDVVRNADPLPTALAFREAIAEDRKKLFGHDENHPGFIAFRERILRQYGVNRIEDLPVSFRGLTLREDDEAGYRIFDRHFGRLQAQVERQDARRSMPGFVFPMLALQPVSMAMAGTDNRHHHHFVRAAEEHRRLIQTAASRELIDHARNGDNNYVAPESTWSGIPSFDYQQPGALWAWRGHWLNLGSLALWCAACCALAWRVALRPRIL
jgi:ABC-2 type transport system permease protein